MNTVLAKLWLEYEIWSDSALVSFKIASTDKEFLYENDIDVVLAISNFYMLDVIIQYAPTFLWGSWEDHSDEKEFAYQK